MAKTEKGHGNGVNETARLQFIELRDSFCNYILVRQAIKHNDMLFIASFHL